MQVDPDIAIKWTFQQLLKCHRWNSDVTIQHSSYFVFVIVVLRSLFFKASFCTKKCFKGHVKGPWNNYTFLKFLQPCFHRVLFYQQCHLPSLTSYIVLPKLTTQMLFSSQSITKLTTTTTTTTTTTEATTNRNDEHRNACLGGGIQETRERRKGNKGYG